MIVRPVACSRCGATTDTAPDGRTPLTWTHEATADGVRPLCEACTRLHLRAIEARLDEQWW